MGTPESFDIQKPPVDRMWGADILWVPFICQGQKIRAKITYKLGMKEIETFEHTQL